MSDQIISPYKYEFSCDGDINSLYYICPNGKLITFLSGIIEQNGEWIETPGYAP
jgi:hypothetical protein